MQKLQPSSCGNWAGVSDIGQIGTEKVHKSTSSSRAAASGRQAHAHAQGADFRPGMLNEGSQVDAALVACSLASSNAHSFPQCDHERS